MSENNTDDRWLFDYLRDSKNNAADTLLWNGRAVENFGYKMKAKLGDASLNGRHGWHDPDVISINELKIQLASQFNKSKIDYVDVANFAMMIHYREQLI